MGRSVRLMPLIRLRRTAAALLAASLLVAPAGALVLATAGGVLLLGPAAAQAQGGSPASSNPFTPGLPGQPSIPTTSPPAVTTIQPTTTSSGGGLSATSAAGIGIGALVVLGGISFFIWYDARRRAPVRARAAAAGLPGESKPGSKRAKPRKLSPAERRRRKRGRAPNRR